MAKKSQKLVPLTLQDIILRGDAETIRQALEARVKIDELLEERENAYRRISELEQQVEEIVGEECTFPFPEPPIPVASFDLSPVAKKPAAKTKKPTEPASKPAAAAALPTAKPHDAAPTGTGTDAPADSAHSGDTA